MKRTRIARQSVIPRRENLKKIREAELTTLACEWLAFVERLALLVSPILAIVENYPRAGRNGRGPPKRNDLVPRKDKSHEIGTPRDEVYETPWFRSK